MRGCPEGCLRDPILIKSNPTKAPQSLLKKALQLRVRKAKRETGRPGALHSNLKSARQEAARSRATPDPEETQTQGAGLRTAEPKQGCG